jgi:hypothetical protein
MKCTEENESAKENEGTKKNDKNNSLNLYVDKTFQN